MLSASMGAGDRPIEGSRPRALRRALAASLGLVLALSLAVVFLFQRREGREERALRALVEGGTGIFDSFADPDVARILQPGLAGRDFKGVPISSNPYGLREREYAYEKPDGVVRVVLLGDSFVFGYGVGAEDRLGVFLEEYLRARGRGAEVECLHLAVSSWNIRSECAYLRRQLGSLRPDLVVQVTVVNDLDDVHGVRGFGSMGLYSPQVPARANGLVSQLSYPPLWPKKVVTYLLYGLDQESRERYAGAGADIAALARAVERGGGRYLLVGAWESYNPMVLEHLMAGLEERQRAFVSAAFTADTSYRHDEEDRHWNRAGHEAIARMLYGLIVERGLLPDLALEPWDEAERAAREIHGAGLGDARRAREYQAFLAGNARERVRSSFELAALDAQAAKQVHGGIDDEGFVAPYAALILARRGGKTLELAGERLDEPGFTGGSAQVLVEEFPVGRIALAGAGAIDETWPLPAGTLAREFLTVRFVSDDYAYARLANGYCASFVLRSVAIR
jgi:lysophospholipase L1-like esterase